MNANELKGDLLIVLKGVELRNLGPTDGDAAHFLIGRDCVDFPDFNAGADAVIRCADGNLFVYAPNGPGCSDEITEAGPWAGVWCWVPSLASIANH